MITCVYPCIVPYVARQIPSALKKTKKYCIDLSRCAVRLFLSLRLRFTPHRQLRHLPNCRAQASVKFYCSQRLKSIFFNTSIDIIDALDRESATSSMRATSGPPSNFQWCPKLRYSTEHSIVT